MFVTGGSSVWQSSTSDIRALQKAASGSTDRLAACWTSTTTYDIALHLGTGQLQQVALYLLDWDNQSRALTVQAVDGDTGAVLDTRTASAFVGGEYLVWDLQGDVTLRLINTGSSPSAVVSGIFFDPGPVAPVPAGLTATAVSGSRVDLTWSSTSANVSGYEIEQSSDGSTWLPVTTVYDAGVDSDTVTGSFQGSTTYDFRVRGEMSQGSYSAYATTSVTTPAFPTTPEAGTAMAQSATAVTLSWPAVAGATGFLVQRSAGGIWANIGSVSTGVTSFTDSGLNPATTYSYRVLGTNAAGVSEPGTFMTTTTAVASRSPVTVTVSTVSATSEVAFTTQVATFTTTDSGTTERNFTAIVGWGDGSTTQGTVVKDSSGHFAVEASHTYATNGSYALSVIVTEQGTSPATGSSTALVSIAPVPTPWPLHVIASSGTVFSGTVATFSAPGHLATDFTATVDWGDGTAPSAATVVASGGVNGAFRVIASHTYNILSSSSGVSTYPFGVELFDSSGRSAGATGQADVSGGTPLDVVYSITDLYSGVFGTFNGLVDSQPSDYRATITIYYDDGSEDSCDGTVTSVPPVSFR